MNKKRSIGLTASGIICLVIAVYSFIYIFIAPDITRRTLLHVYWIMWGSSFFITGIGLISVKAWARVFALVLISISVVRLVLWSVRDVFLMVENSVDCVVILSWIGVVLVSIIMQCGFIYYLACDKVKKQFR